MNNDKTMQFSLNESEDTSAKDIVKQVYRALEIKGYDPKNQLIGYILSEDPTYITSYNNARCLVRKIDRYELLSDMIDTYLK